MQSKAESEDIVQNVFLKIWNEAESLNIQSSVRYYLIRMARNACMDRLKHQKIVLNHADAIWNNPQGEELSKQYILYSELQRELAKGLESMNAPLREVFEMSRFQNKTQKEIAEELGVSVRAVEDRMSKALSHLRIILKDYLTCFLLFMPFVDVDNFLSGVL